ncbi:MAG TPA: hypothetical protein EYP19_17130 [Desulfobacterales bacterium]|nr:hypothetical protein [Desulfobacterales bacterium]
MPRQRFIHPQIWSDPTLGKLTPIERLFFIGCFSNADDEGRLVAVPAYLRSIIFPYDDLTIDQVREIRDRVVDVCRNLILYEVDGTEYLSFVKWSRYQKPKYPSPSILPPPPEPHSPIPSKIPEKDSSNIPEMVPEDFPTGMGMGIDMGMGNRDWEGGVGETHSPDGGDLDSENQDQNQDDEGEPGSPESSHTYTPEFAAFYAVYPRKREKRKAFRAWSKLMKLPAKIRPRTEDLIAAARHYAEYCKKNVRDPTFIKYPATFLSVRDRPWEEYVSSVPAETEEDAERKKRREKYKDVYLS